MDAFPYQLAAPEAPTLGLIVLQADETVEHDFRRLFPADRARLHVTRVPSGAELTRQSIAAMEGLLPAAAGLLPPAARFDAVGYACTSGTTLIGAGRVHALVQASTCTSAVTDPLTAAFAAAAALGLGRIGIVSPYIASVAGPIRAAFEAQGLSVSDTLSFGEESEARVARISPASIAEAARTLGRGSRPDGLFLSCTNLRSLDLIGDLEAELGVPVLSSNQVLAWHMARLAGVPAFAGPGLLFSV